MSPNLLNCILYQTGWLAAVVGAGQGHPWLGLAAASLLVIVHLVIAREHQSEAALVLVAGGIGLLVDSTLVGVGRLTFSSGMVVSWLCPPWIVVMWMQFATTLRFSLRWPLPRPLVAAGFGAVGGPLAYTIGERLGAVTLHPPRTLTLTSLGLVWMVAVSLLAWWASRTDGAGYRLRAVGEEER